MPSIDISRGKAVKRVRGIRGSGIIVGDPIEVASELYSLGYSCIHIVDLDAVEGTGSNEYIVKNAASIGFKWIQVGGGIRSIDRASRLISYGASAIVISTAFFMDREIFYEIYNGIGWDKILISIDYDSNRNVMVKGWGTTAIDLDTAVKLVRRARVLGTVFTYISTEGTCMGIDRSIRDYISTFSGLKEYAGGVATYDDLLFLKNVGFDYAVIGMALYKGCLRGVKYV
ncbi:MAG: 1-(5-phosphoribosyl)-5-((5-phosphoribosylamino)methylideneamino)imidazole-4-carboxamide isomerase [Ignisphaera sp.]|nr:1-(5-phosphoribosyl)-5-((5-phosphoribosylamino)methylideneamino)imidazole-4-carboxamide isomerase [Ignisphaera sp.]